MINFKKIYDLKDEPPTVREEMTSKGLKRVFLTANGEKEVINTHGDGDDLVKIFQEIINGATKDFETYAGETHNIKSRVIFATAAGFLFDPNYMIDYGDATLTFEEMFLVAFPGHSLNMFRRSLIEKVLTENPTLDPMFYIDVMWRTFNV